MPRDSPFRRRLQPGHQRAGHGGHAVPHGYTPYEWQEPYPQELFYAAEPHPYPHHHAPSGFPQAPRHQPQGARRMQGPGPYVPIRSWRDRGRNYGRGSDRSFRQPSPRQCSSQQRQAEGVVESPRTSEGAEPLRTSQGGYRQSRGTGGRGGGRGLRRGRGGSAEEEVPVTVSEDRPTEQTEAAIETEEKVEEDARIRAGEIKAQNSASGIETFCATCRDYLANDNSQACFLFDKQLQEVLLNTNKEERKQHIREFLIMVNALLNDGGGVIYVHTQPRLLGFWDEQVDDELMHLITNGTIFDENFEREIAKDHVIFRVKPPEELDRPVSTLDFHSKVSMNKGITDPTQEQMRHLVTREPPPDDDRPPTQIINIENLSKDQEVQFHEDLSTQAKVVLEKKLTKVAGNTRAQKLLNYWWNNLKLAKFIAAFSKQAKGGTFILGLKEDKEKKEFIWTKVTHVQGVNITINKDCELKLWKDDKKDVYYLATEEHASRRELKKGRFICHGIELSTDEEAELIEEFDKRIEKGLLWLPVPYDPDSGDPDLSQLVQLNVHKVSNPANPSQRLCLLEVKVNYFHGVCFQTPEGPEAYNFDKPENVGHAVRMTVDKWAKKAEHASRN